MSFFHLICACKKYDEIKILKQGVNLHERDEQNNCPVYVWFWYIPEKNIYKRMSRMMMHHTHKLELNELNMPGGSSIYHNS